MTKPLFERIDEVLAISYEDFYDFDYQINLVENLRNLLQEAYKQLQLANDLLKRAENIMGKLILELPEPSQKEKS